MYLTKDPCPWPLRLLPWFARSGGVDGTVVELLGDVRAGERVGVRVIRSDLWPVNSRLMVTAHDFLPRGEVVQLARLPDPVEPSNE